MKKKIPYCTEEQLKGVKRTAKIIDFGLSLVLSSAFNELYTAHMMLREEKSIYRFMIKKLANQTIELVNKHKRDMLNLMSNRNFFDSYYDKVIDYAENDVTLLRISIKQEMDDAKMKHGSLMAYLETARALLEISAVMYETIIKDARRDFGKYSWEFVFSEFDCSDVLSVWNKVCDMMYGEGEQIGFNTERSEKLLLAIYKKFNDGIYIKECLKEANKEHPEFFDAIIAAKNEKNV